MSERSRTNLLAHENTNVAVNGITKNVKFTPRMTSGARKCRRKHVHKDKNRAAFVYCWLDARVSFQCLARKVALLCSFSLSLSLAFAPSLYRHMHAMVLGRTSSMFVMLLFPFRVSITFSSTLSPNNRFCRWKCLNYEHSNATIENRVFNRLPI